MAHDHQILDVRKNGAFIFNDILLVDFRQQKLSDLLKDVIAQRNHLTHMVKRYMSEDAPIVGQEKANVVNVLHVLVRSLSALFMKLYDQQFASEFVTKLTVSEGKEVTVRRLVGRTRAMVGHMRATPGRRAVLFIGSSIGNYEGAEAIALLRRIRDALEPGDALVLVTDLVKPGEILVPAYDDAAGVTAAFNKNVLARLDRELGADFELDRFRHVALWNPARSRIEMHLESTIAQVVTAPGAGLTVELAAGERIHTESSVKYDLAMIDRLLGEGGFTREGASRAWMVRGSKTVGSGHAGGARHT